MDDRHMHEFTLLPGAGDFMSPIAAPKPSNCRTAKTAWKERRRRANLPRPMQKRLRLAGA